MPQKWYNPKKSIIKKHRLVLYHEYKPVIYGTKEQIDFLVDNLLKEKVKEKYVIKKSNGLYTLNKKIKYYKKRE